MSVSSQVQADSRFRITLRFLSGFCVAALTAIVVFLLSQALPTLMETPLSEFFFSEDWYPTDDVPSFGIMALIAGSLSTALLTSVLAVPLGVLTAAALHCSPPKVRKFIKPAIELMAAFPSVVIGLIGMAAGMIGALALSAIATVAPLPGDLSATLGLTQDNIQAMVFSCALCAIVGSGVAAIETPIYLRFGQTKATQWIPMISVLLFISPAIILGATGGLGNFAGIADTIRGIFAFIETPVGAAVSLVVALAVSAIILGISAAISLALYDRREL